MHSQKGTEIGHTEIKADLALHLWEGLVRELIARDAITEAALTRILDSSAEAAPSLFNSEELRRVYDQIRARLEEHFPTALERADRDEHPNTED